MIKNYFKIAWRNLWKNKTFSFINILGLSIGISVCFIIMLFVQDELSYDNFNEKADRIVRVIFKANIDGGKINEANVMPPTAQVLKKDYPEVETATRLRSLGKPKVILGDKVFKDGTFACVDANFFDVFTIPFIKGDAKTALEQPNTVVITKELAKQYFGDSDPIGRTITLDDKSLMKITGVIEKLPTNAHFHFDMLGSMATLSEANSSSWMQSNFFTYLVLQKGYNFKKLEAKLPEMVDKYMGPQILKAMGMDMTQFRAKGNELGFALQPLKDIHLHSESTSELEPGGDVKYVFIFGIIALFMLLIACINFINLSTAGASKRAKEVGIRKVVGSDKWALIKQFLLESVLVTFFALLISIVLIQISLPIFNDLSNKNLSLGLNIKLIASLLALSLVVGLLAGIYPAFYLSAFKPIAVLKGKLRASNRSFGIRSGLVVFQFFISVSLIVGTMIVYQQMKFIQNTNLGYSKEQLLVLQNSYVLGDNERVFKEEMLKDSRVINITTSGYKPAGPSFSNNSLAYPDGKTTQIMRLVRYDIDEQYIPTLGIEMAKGRNFSKELSTDSSSVIVNETAAKAFGWGNDAIGKSITWLKGSEGDKNNFNVIGVVKDFHFKSLHETITPLIMVLQPQSGLIIKVKTGDVQGLLASMKREWEKYNLEEPFSYAFMDDLYEKMYAREQKTSQILNIFTALIIFVACLGLYGLATFTAEQRTKEIGIRKVLGASVPNIIALISKEFIVLVGIAIIIATPIAWWAMHNWLQDFAYRIDISWWVFGLAGIIALLIALITISFQAIKAAMANPVKSLRTE